MPITSEPSPSSPPPDLIKVIREHAEHSTFHSSLLIQLSRTGQLTQKQQDAAWGCYKCDEYYEWDEWDSPNYW